MVRTWKRDGDLKSCAAYQEVQHGAPVPRRKKQQNISRYKRPREESTVKTEHGRRQLQAHITHVRCDSQNLSVPRSSYCDSMECAWAGAPRAHAMTQCHTHCHCHPTGVKSKSFVRTATHHSNRVAAYRERFGDNIMPPSRVLSGNISS